MKKKENLIKAGIEFVRLTHMDRYILNEHIALMEKKIFPAPPVDPEGDDEADELWRGNRRRHYRLDISNLDLMIELDFRPSRVKLISAKIINISPIGCKVLIPESEEIEPEQRIPRVRLALDDDVIVCRARVVYVSNSRSEQG